jgi:hypothetical protein
MAVVSIKNKLRRGNLLVGNDPYIPTDFESIATGTVTAGNTSSVITFSSIPSTYTHLQLRMLARATASDTMYVRFNNDSGATNYDNHRMNGNGSSAASDARIDYSALFVSSRGYGIASTANIGSAVIMDILDYANTNKHKTTRTLSGQELNTSNSDIEFTSGRWKSTNAIDRIDVSISSSTLAQYTHIALYGIKAA